MNLDNILTRIAHLSTHESDFAAAFIISLNFEYLARGVVVTPTRVLRVEDVLICELVAKNLEAVLWRDGCSG